MFKQLWQDVLKAHFHPYATRVATQFPVTRNSQIIENLLKSSFSRAILDIKSTSRHFTVSLQYFEIWPEESEENLSVTLGSLLTL